MPTIPDRYRYAVVPHLLIDGAAEAIDFYAAAYGAEPELRIDHPDGRILHGEIRIGESVLMLGDAGAGPPPGASRVLLHVYVDDVDALHARAVAAGATSQQPPTDMFHGDRTAVLQDPYGHVWVFLTHLEDLTPEQLVGQTLR